MQEFEQQLLRLKTMLRMTSDQDVAAALGMSKAAFSDRKRRNSFPADKLYALAATRPDLVIDAEFVLTGKSAKERYIGKHGYPPADHEALTQYAIREAVESSNVATSRHLTGEELELLALYRKAPLMLKMKAVAILAGDTDPPEGNTSVNVRGKGNRAAGRDYNERKE